MFTFIVVFVMFLLDSAMCIIDVNDAIKELSFTLTSDSSLSLADRYDLTNTLPWPVETALYAFMVRSHSNYKIRQIGVFMGVFLQSNLGGVVVVWRVYAFYCKPHERWLLAIPMALLVGSFGANLDVP